MVATVRNHRLGEMSDLFRKGVFDIKADRYVEPQQGVPFIRVGDLGPGLIRKHSTAWIDTADHAIEHATGLTRGDLILSKTAYPAAAMVNVPECNVSQDTIAIRWNPFGAAHYRTGFVAAYLNSVWGRTLMARRFQGNVQTHLSLEDAKGVRIPCFSLVLQKRIHEMLCSADVQLDNSHSQQLEAEQVMLRRLGFTVWRSPEPLSYTARLQDILAARRMDAQYYMPAKESVRRALLQRRGRPLSNWVDDVRQLFVPGRVPGTMRVRNYDVSDALLPALDAETAVSLAADLGSTKKRFSDGDVVISRLRSYLREIAVVQTEDDVPSVGSSEFIVLRPKRGPRAISPECLMVFLRSPPVQAILRWCQDGSQHPRFSRSDLLSIPVPDAVVDASDEIGTIVTHGFRAREEARRLLETAIRSVEIALEHGESAAHTVLDKRGGAN